MPDSASSSSSVTELAVVDGNFTVHNTSSSDDGNMSTGLAFATSAIVIPATVFGIIVCILLIYYVWNVVSSYLEAKEEEKAAAAEAAKKAPIAEPEDVSIPIPPADESVPAADSVEPEVEDTAATDGDVEEGKHAS